MRFVHRRSLSLTLVLAIMLMLVAACGGTPATSSGSGAATSPAATASGSQASTPVAADEQTAAATASGTGAEQTAAATANGTGVAQAVGCDVSAEPAVTVNVLAYNSSAIDPYSNAMVEQCSKNGVTVEHAPIDFSGQYERTGTTLAGDEGTYDIIEIYSGAVARYASADKLVELDDLFAKYKDAYQLGDLNQTMLDGLSYNGKLYALPMQANVTIMVYRKDIFDELALQPPTTYAELLTAATKIKESGKMEYPVALPFADSTSTMYEQVMRSQGKSYHDPTTDELTFQTPEAERGLQALVDLAPYMDPQVISLNQPKVQQQLYNGQAAIAMMFSGRMADLLNPENTEYADRFAFAPPPKIDANGTIGSTLSVDGWTLAKNSKIDPELLFQIIASSVSPEASMNSLPAAYPARDGIVTEANVPYAAAVQSALASGASTPPMETWLGAVQGAMAPLIQEAIIGKRPVSEALAEAHKAATAALNP